MVEDELEKVLGLSRYDGEDRERKRRWEVVWGLVVTGMGEGVIMPVESITTPGSGLSSTPVRLAKLSREHGART